MTVNFCDEITLLICLDDKFAPVTGGAFENSVIKWLLFQCKRRQAIKPTEGNSGYRLFLSLSNCQMQLDTVCVCVYNVHILP